MASCIPATARHHGTTRLTFRLIGHREEMKVHIKTRTSRVDDRRHHHHHHHRRHGPTSNIPHRRHTIAAGMELHQTLQETKRTLYMRRAWTPLSSPGGHLRHLPRSPGGHLAAPPVAAGSPRGHLATLPPESLEGHLMAADVAVCASPTAPRRAGRHSASRKKGGRRGGGGESGESVVEGEGESSWRRCGSRHARPLHATAAAPPAAPSRLTYPLPLLNVAATRDHHHTRATNTGWGDGGIPRVGHWSGEGAEMVVVVWRSRGGYG
ncbi:hypothetical protein E2C01_069288 [Portunus trituberculatus]|uniref:Uncharacterized protein n=1 Tax=Portunus trituberculatus TaxID=210409 RepID=A0A5B7I1S6_PORTR|nr:hypothetical protein [Portunus trituberculatus]